MIAPFKCYQGHGGPERGKRGKREGDFQPLYPKTRIGREKEAAQVSWGPDYCCDTIRHSRESVSGRHRLRTLSQRGDRAAVLLALVQMLEQKVCSLEGSKAFEHMRRNF